MSSRSENSAPISVDLFCGAGGLSEGLKAAGYQPLVAVDFDPSAIESYRKNHPDTQALCADITKLKASVIREIVGDREIDLVAGGPSCQGFSTHGKRDENDPRNFLFKHFLRLAKELNPRWILIENVRGLLTYRGGFFRDQICKSLQDMGYEVDCKVLCAADYGVPQLRHRIFFLANRVGIPVEFPKATHADPEVGTLFPKLKPWVTLAEALGDLPPALEHNSISHDDYVCAPQSAYQKYVRHRNAALTLHSGRPLSAQANQIAQFIKQGQGIRQVPSDQLPERFHKMRKISNGKLRSDCTTLYHRLSWQRPSYTITCNFRNVASGPFLHPVEDRSITPREAARLMSFQDRYLFVGNGIPRQIGNAVPPLLALAVGRKILSMDKGGKNPQALERKIALT